jgi:hypothetical protein
MAYEVDGSRFVYKHLFLNDTFYLNDNTDDIQRVTFKNNFLNEVSEGSGELSLKVSLQPPVYDDINASFNYGSGLMIHWSSHYGILRNLRCRKTCNVR